MARSLTSSQRTALICGPYQSGKTSLFEALLSECGALKHRNSPAGSFRLGDGSPEARAHNMSTEMNVATADYLGENWTFIDCPGFVELMHETRCAMSIADVAVVVVEPEIDKAITLTTYLKLLDELSVPHILFINKFDKKNISVRALLEAFQASSDKPLVLREIPIREGETVTGHVDLVSERAFNWQENKPSDLVSLPKLLQERESAARNELFENLADFDDELLEKLLEDVVPSTSEIYANLTRDLSSNLVVPVFFGSATHGNGIRRLFKALRHEVPHIESTAERLGIDDRGETQVKIFKTLNAGHAGKLSLGRVMRGALGNGDTLNNERPASITTLFGQTMKIVHQAVAGDVVGFTKLENTNTSDMLTKQAKTAHEGFASPPAPLIGLTIKAENRGDDVKLPDILKKIIEEDPSLSLEFNSQTGEQVLRGQGEMHLKLCLEKMKNRSGLAIELSTPTVPYRETARRKIDKRVRHRKQSGGHGEFGEVHLQIAPLGRGEGFQFNDAIHGGVVPRQYIPAVKAGVIDAMEKGPQGFAVVDMQVTLLDGKHHSVDSSEWAFRKAGAQAMREALAEARTVLLEPVNRVTILVPNHFIARIQKIILGHRGQIFGFDAKPGWIGWDEVSSHIPASGMQDLITEIRSATMGVGSFKAEYDHMQELIDKDIAKISGGALAS